MKGQDNINYERIAEAIQYITENFKEQPSLEDVAAKVHMSQYHFQRLFKDWVGISPKKFLQYLSIEHAKSIIKQNDTTIFDTAFSTGLSSTGRLHDLFIKIEGMTPGEFKNDGENLNINYSFAQSPFGTVLIASTHKGICHIAFIDDKEKALYNLKHHFPKANFDQQIDKNQANALLFFTDDWNELQDLKLHLKGTEFQLKVWESLLKIPMGKLSTYYQMAKGINNPKASRAVGSAIANNPVAYLIPCHRVIRSNGNFGEYRWGETRKKAIIGWESSKSTQ